MIKIRLLKPWLSKKPGDIINISEKSAANFVEVGAAEYLSEKSLGTCIGSQSPEPKGEPVKQGCNSPDDSGSTKEDKNICITEKILDKFATGIVKKEAVYEKEDVQEIEENGEKKKIKVRVAAVNSNPEHKLNYEEIGYSEDIVLWECPPHVFVCEFEEKREKNDKWIRQLEATAKGFGYDYAVYDHGGKSAYFEMYFKDMPMGEDTKKAKLLLAQSLLPAEAVKQLDRTNLGFTLIPIPEHPHWKPKYKGSKHTLKRGKHITEHKNEFPKELKALLKENKKRHDKVFRKNKHDNDWLIDFFTTYCTTHQLPGGARHHIIEKNMAALLMESSEWQQIKQSYLQAQGRQTDTFRTWEVAILTGDYTEPSAGEVYNYIKENNLNYELPERKEDKKPVNFQKYWPE